MDEIFFASILIFLLLVAASVGTLLLYPRLPARHREDDTNTVVRLVANLFVVMTSLVLGLMVNSAKNTYEDIDKDLHSFATQLILFDRTVRDLAPASQEGRQRLIAYVRHTIATPPPTGDPLVRGDRASEGLLNDAGNVLSTIVPHSAQQSDLLSEARQQFRRLVEQRWVIVEQSEDAMPRPLVVMLVAWLVLIFASLGYRAPCNSVVVSMFVVSAFLIAASLCLIMDMNVPFSGFIQVSDRPLRSVLAELEH